ncbi:MAG: Hint domain-containing protein [Halocynthiibacter sp.]
MKKGPMMSTWLLRGVHRQQVNGFFSGVKLLTDMGLQDAQDICVGQHVMTFDEKLQKVTDVSTGKYWKYDEECPPDLWPIFVPEQVFGNATAFLCGAEQTIKIETGGLHDLQMDPCAIVKMKCLIGVRGIKRIRPSSDWTVTRIHCEREQVLFSDCGVLFKSETTAQEKARSVCRGQDAEIRYEPLPRLVTSLLKGRWAQKGMLAS